MQIHILRHGTAEDVKHGGSDAGRKLTAAGRDEVRRAIEHARAKISPSLILSSPFVRAIETAEIAAAVLGYKGNIVRIRALEPSASPHEVWQEIRNRQNETQILLAGHEPLLSQLASYLLAAPAMQIEMRKAMLLRIDIGRFGQDPQGILKWALPPDIWPPQ